MSEKTSVSRRTTRTKLMPPRTPTLNVLYVSVTGQTNRPYMDPSTRYRCFYPAEAARSLGHRAFVASHAVLENIDPSLFDLIIVHRPSFGPALLHFVRRAAASHTRVIADYDDLIFNPAFARQSSMFAKSWDLSAVQITFERNTDALRLFNEFTVSTEPLRAALLALHPSALVHLLPNAIPGSLISMVEAKAYHAAVERPFVGYFPGTATHDDDFRIAAEGVAAFCRDRGAPLRIVGPLHVDPGSFHDVQVEHTDIVPFACMFDVLAECRVVIAPLVDSNFNAAKSHIKILESALALTACVASSIPDMVQCAKDLPIGGIVEPISDWGLALGAAWDTYSLEAAAESRSLLARRFGATTLVAPILQGAC